MSEESANTSAVADTGSATAPALDAGDSASQSTSSEPVDVYGDQSYDEAFGLEPEPVGQGEETTKTDAPAATDTPAPRQGEEVKEEKQSADSDQPSAEAKADDKTDKTATFEFNDKLNWDDEKAPKQF